MKILILNLSLQTLPLVKRFYTKMLIISKLSICILKELFTQYIADF